MDPLPDKERLFAGALGLSMALAFIKKPSFREITFALSGGTACSCWVAPLLSKKLFGDSRDWLIVLTAFMAITGGLFIQAIVRWFEKNSDRLLNNAFKRYTTDEPPKP